MRFKDSAFVALVFAIGIFIFVAVSGVATHPASAAGGVHIVSDGFSPNFSPNPVDPGASTVLSLTVSQDNPAPDATVTINTHTSDLSFVSNGDSSASCSTTGNKTTCTYTDFAHGYKSDNYTFAVSPDATPGEFINSNVSVSVGGGSASTTSSVQVTPPPPPPPTTTTTTTTTGEAPLPPPALPVIPKYVAPESNVFICLPGDAGNPEVLPAKQAATQSGRWNPYAVMGATAGFDHAGNYNLTCVIPAGMKDTGKTVDVNGQGEENTFRSFIGNFEVVA